MTIGPAMTNKALDGRPSVAGQDPVQVEILETMRRILDRLDAMGGQVAAPRDS